MKPSLNTLIIERVGHCDTDSHSISTYSFSLTDRGYTLLSSTNSETRIADEGKSRDRLGCTVPKSIRNKIWHMLILLITNAYASPQTKNPTGLTSCKYSEK